MPYVERGTRAGVETVLVFVMSLGRSVRVRPHVWTSARPIEVRKICRQTSHGAMAYSSGTLLPIHVGLMGKLSSPLHAIGLEQQLACLCAFLLLNSLHLP